MRIGIIGGSFNPPHKSHYQMALEVLNHGLVDKIIYVPTGDKYAKEGLLPGIHRFNMVRLMCEGNNLITASNYEIERGASYTYETLDYFQKENPEDKIYFIMGTDLVSDIEKWKNPDHILTNYKVLWIKRKGIEVAELPDIYNKYNDSLVMHDFDMDELSSTMVREKIKNGDYNNLKEYLNENVLEYIISNELYK